VHLDLATYSKAEHSTLVTTLIERGATRIDLGQGDVDWVVLADPEGNEFCVVEPRPRHRYSGRLATIMLETVNAEATGQFWATASGWNVFSHGPDGAILRDAAWRGPWLVIGDHDDPPSVKNRIHFDVARRWSGTTSTPRSSASSRPAPVASTSGRATFPGSSSPTPAPTSSASSTPR